MNEKNAIVGWLDQQQIKNYSINDDLTVDVQGNVDISKRKLTHIPVQFNYVTGYFDCAENNLTSLKGSPLYIVDDFYIGHNQLTDLKHSPLKIEGSMYCPYNKLVTLEGCTQDIGAYFSCDYNLLTSLKGGPKSVYNDYCASHNPKLVSFEGCPETVGEDIILLNCPLKDLEKFTSSFNQVVFSKHCITDLINSDTQISFNWDVLQIEKRRLFSDELDNVLPDDKFKKTKLKI